MSTHEIDPTTYELVLNGKIGVDRKAAVSFFFLDRIRSGLPREYAKHTKYHLPCLTVETFNSA